jgi:vancomycin permeability regulator SanA
MPGSRLAAACAIALLGQQSAAVPIVAPQADYALQLETIALDATDREVYCGDGACTSQKIVILGEKLKPDASPTLDLTNRVNMAAALFRKTSVPIIASGGDVEKVMRTEASCMLDLLTGGHGVNNGSITLEDKSMNTVENAVNVMRMLQEPTHIFLITSEFHMPRSEFIFDQIISHEGLKHSVTTHPSPSHRDRLCDNLLDELNHFKKRWVLDALRANSSLILMPDSRYGHAWDELKRMHARDC